MSRSGSASARGRTSTRLRVSPARPRDAAFTTALDNPGTIGRVSAGVDVYTSDRVQLRLQYDGGFADDQTENGGQVRVSYRF